MKKTSSLLLLFAVLTAVSLTSGCSEEYPPYKDIRNDWIVTDYTPGKGPPIMDVLIENTPLWARYAGMRRDGTHVFYDFSHRRITIHYDASGSGYVGTVYTLEHVRLADREYVEEVVRGFVPLPDSMNHFIHIPDDSDVLFQFWLPDDLNSKPYFNTWVFTLSMSSLPAIQSVLEDDDTTS